MDGPSGWAQWLRGLELLGARIVKGVRSGGDAFIKDCRI
jgi:hypothetical protein